MYPILFAADFPVLVVVLCLLSVVGAALASVIGESAEHTDNDDHGH